LRLNFGGKFLNFLKVRKHGLPVGG
jgi:hypothetical protein